MRKIIFWTLLGLAVLVGGLAIIMGPGIARVLKVTKVALDPQLTLFLGGGGNSLVLSSPDPQQVLVVDTKIGPGAQALKDYVAALGPDAQVTIVNTHDHPDHAGGNQLFDRATIIAGGYTDEEWKTMVRSRLPDQRLAVGKERTLKIGDETVKLLDLGQAHTTHDTVVYLVNRKLLHTGDLLFNGLNPVLKHESDANVGKWVQALTLILSRYDIQTVVPGHGPVTDRNGVQAMADYFSSIMTALDDPQQLAQVKKKYQAYFSLPGMSSFDQTVKYIRAEQAATGKRKP